MLFSSCNSFVNLTLNDSQLPSSNDVLIFNSVNCHADSISIITNCTFLLAIISVILFKKLSIIWKRQSNLSFKESLKKRRKSVTFDDENNVINLNLKQNQNELNDCQSKNDYLFIKHLSFTLLLTCHLTILIELLLLNSAFEQLIIYLIYLICDLILFIPFKGQYCHQDDQVDHLQVDHLQVDHHHVNYNQVDYKQRYKHNYLISDLFLLIYYPICLCWSVTKLIVIVALATESYYVLVRFYLLFLSPIIYLILIFEQLYYLVSESF